ncbi:lytic murein transglycosylase [Phenylobacterium sp.]|uniref:lytic murein transglycosylase n=1 Tax=Phenylobacterium sp. TaxID=1871053 RepID=UPI002730B678|nr:lytic murein transglycosylase [Phenylobacterium sp.]MDP2214271.1 lytic murein transglycosylase [Phenylobacterium sp.]
MAIEAEGGEPYGSMMDRRSFLVLVVAGCADPAASLNPPLGLGPVTPTPQRPEPVVNLSPSGSATFDAWLRSFYVKAVRAGLPSDLLDRELAGLTPNDRISALDSRQPEFSRPVSAYINGVVTDDRIAIGRRRRDALPALAQIESRFGVPRDVLVAIWGLESGFGAILGDFDVVRSMATLAADGRRREFAEDQLMAALKIIGSGEFPRSRLVGSWAGAMGQTQFIPTTFLATAIDGDGDGRRDLWGSSADALASAANLLAKAGWRRGESWHREVVAPPGFDYALTEGPREIPSWWAERGVRAADGRPFSAADQQAPAELIAPSGAGGPLFLIFHNHFMIRRYNNSTAYALGVGLLAQRLGGEGQLVRNWPQETPLALTDRSDAQRALALLGFDPGTPDGIVGINTRKALRDYQVSRGLVADGYLSLEMVRRLRTEAASQP